MLFFVMLSVRQQKNSFTFIYIQMAKTGKKIDAYNDLSQMN